MHILKSQRFEREELLLFAESLSLRSGGREDKLLHWDFGPLMEMRFDRNASNYLFSEEHVPFHWDGAFHREPRTLLFYCTETEGEGGETLFTDTEKIWRDLTLGEKEDLRKVTLTYKTEKLAHYGGEVQVPLVQAHPVTGAMILRIAERVETLLNPVSLAISGALDGEELYRYLTGKLYDPRYLYEHRWEKGDLLLCDNHTYLHGRKALGDNKKRTFQRIQIL